VFFKEPIKVSQTASLVGDGSSVEPQSFLKNHLRTMICVCVPSVLKVPQVRCLRFCIRELGSRSRVKGWRVAGVMSAGFFSGWRCISDLMEFCCAPPIAGGPALSSAGRRHSFGAFSKMISGVPTVKNTDHFRSSATFLQFWLQRIN